MLNKRAKGRRFEKLEEAAWKASGWETQLTWPEARFIGPGRAVSAYRDFFGKYDLIVASPRADIVIMIQVSTEPVSSHKDPGPMGFGPPRNGYSVVPVEEIMRIHQWPHSTFRGVYEAYTRYVRFKRGPYVAVRAWWTKVLSKPLNTDRALLPSDVASRNLSAVWRTIQGRTTRAKIRDA